MTIDLNLREAQRLKLLLERSMAQLAVVNDENYPSRQADYELVAKLTRPADPYYQTVKNFTLTQEQWDAFTTALEQQPRIISRLKRLFAEPSILEHPPAE